MKAREMAELEVQLRELEQQVKALDQQRASGGYRPGRVTGEALEDVL
jgi:hypothetical protein